MSTKQEQQQPRQVQYSQWQNFLIAHVRSFFRALGEFVRTPFASLTTLLVLAIAITLPTGLFLMLKNIESIGQAWHGQPSISLYVNKDTSIPQIQLLQEKLSQMPGIAHVKYISPDDGLAEMSKNSQFQDVVNQLPNNPLPGVFVVTPVFDRANQAALGELFQSLNTIEGVSHGELDTTWLSRLYYIVTIGERLTYTLAILFALGVILITANTIRLTTEKQHEEINVLKLLGAKGSFIKRPLLYRGLLYGVLAAILSWLFITALVQWVEAPTTALVASYRSIFHLQQLTAENVIALIMLGGTLGWIGAYFAVSRQLKHPEVL